MRKTLYRTVNGGLRKVGPPARLKLIFYNSSELEYPSYEIQKSVQIILRETRNRLEVKDALWTTLFTLEVALGEGRLNTQVTVQNSKHERLTYGQR